MLAFIVFFKYPYIKPVGEDAGSGQKIQIRFCNKFGQLSALAL